jgi:transcriptional antiterminator Rof (Rho-off)
LANEAWVSTRKIAAISRELKESTAKLTKTKSLCLEYKNAEQATLAAAQDQKLRHLTEIDSLKINHKEETRKLRRDHAGAVALREDKIEKMEEEQLGYIELYSGVVEEYDELVGKDKSVGQKIGSLTNIAKMRLRRVRDLRNKHREVEASLVTEKLDMM